MRLQQLIKLPWVAQAQPLYSCYKRSTGPAALAAVCHRCLTGIIGCATLTSPNVLQSPKGLCTTIIIPWLQAFPQLVGVRIAATASSCKLHGRSYRLYGCSKALLYNSCQPFGWLASISCLLYLRCQLCPLPRSQLSFLSPLCQQYTHRARKSLVLKLTPG